MLRKLNTWLLGASAVALLVCFWNRNDLPRQSDLDSRLADEPDQRPATRPALTLNYSGVDYRVEPLYEYELHGLVVSYRQHDGESLMQYSYAFVAPAQWREVRAHPELLSALQPNDLRPAGTCDIKLTDDLNSVSYSCGGSAPVLYTRVQHDIDP